MTQCISYLHVHTSRKLMFQLGGGVFYYSHGVWYPHETGKANKKKSD
jgi:hypothetical protein